MKPIHRHTRASLDIDDATAHYLEHAPPGVADRFVLAFERALVHIAEQPGTGSLRHAQAARIEGLRFWTLNPFPFAVFYVERINRIDVLRVLHQASDVPHHLLSK